MSGSHIVPVQPASGEGETVVLEVRQEGAQLLDVRLVACEGENPFVSHLQHSKTGKLKLKFRGTDDEWRVILAYFLLQQQPGEHEGLLKNVSLVYSIKNSSIILAIRQDVNGIKITLGEIIVPRNDDFEINPFEWAQASAQSHSTTLQELTVAKADISDSQDAIAKLSAQLDEFIELKKVEEDQMLRHFMQLLNEKKRKIRDQNRLLATAKVDKTVANEIKSTREETKIRKPDSSRAAKRKAANTAAEPEVKSEPPFYDDAMEVDGVVAEKLHSSEPEAVTPDRSDDGTEDEAGSNKGVASSSADIRNFSTGAQHQQASEEPERPPARRELPFQRRTREKVASKKHQMAGNEDDDETEDEL